MNKGDDAATLVLLVAAGSALIGVGKLLNSGETITCRLAAGRAIVHAALGVGGAFSVLAWMPDIPNLALVGLAAVSASVGESAIEGLLNAYIRRSK